MTTGKDKYKMLEAFAVFSNNKNRQLKFNSRDIANIREANSIASSIRNTGNQHYLFRAPASDDLREIRSTNAKSSRWVNDGVSEKFSTEHEMLVESGTYKYGRLPFSSEWIAKTTANAIQLNTPEANAKRKQTLTGKKKSKEHRKSMSDSMKLRPNIKCIHCGKETNQLNNIRWHGDKCQRINVKKVATS